MSVILDQSNRGPKATQPVLRGDNLQTGDEPLMLLTEDFLAGRPLVVEPQRSGPEGYLLAWTVPLIFCSGLCGLVASSLLEVAVPRWVILSSGLGCALLALLAPVARR